MAPAIVETIAAIAQLPGIDNGSASTGNRGPRERDSSGIPDLHQLLDYMPKRGDFAYEYEAEADNLVVDLDFQYESDDNEEEV